MHIFDPPYSEYVQTKSRAGARKEPLKNGQGKIHIDREHSFDFAHLTAAEMQALAASASLLAERWICTFCDVESAMLWRSAYEAHNCKYVRTCDWEKVCGAPQFTGDRPGVPSESIVVMSDPHYFDRFYLPDPTAGKVLLTHPRDRGLIRGKTWWNGGGRLGCYTVQVVQENRPGSREARESTAQKPEKLMEMLVVDFSREGELVYDLTCGFGTTLVAAARLHRKAVGVEMREEQAEKTARRIDAFYEGVGYREKEAGASISIFDLASH